MKCHFCAGFFIIYCATQRKMKNGKGSILIDWRRVMKGELLKRSHTDEQRALKRSKEPERDEKKEGKSNL